MRVNDLRCGVRWAIGGAAAALSIAAVAATPASDIVVRGKALSKEEAEAKAQAFVQATGMVTTVKPAARWVERICPRILGLGDAGVAGKVEARIREVASQSGAKLAKPGCERGNLLVVFTADADDLARRINEKNPRLMAEAAAAWRGKLINGKVPVRWWYQSAVRSADGMPPTTAPLPWMSMEMSGGGDGGSSGGVASSNDVGGDNGGGYNNNMRASMVSTNAKRALSGATILIDANLAQGKELEAVTDYASLVGLAEIRFAGDPPPDSVLSLFSPESPTYGLTTQDFALLKSLYRLPLDRHGRYHRGWLVKDVSKVLTGEN